MEKATESASDYDAGYFDGIDGIINLLIKEKYCITTGADYFSVDFREEYVPFSEIEHVKNLIALHLQGWTAAVTISDEKGHINLDFVSPDPEE